MHNAALQMYFISDEILDDYYQIRLFRKSNLLIISLITSQRCVREKYIKSYHSRKTPAMLY